MAVVTGAASGIGRGLAERFVAEGMKVVMADVEEKPLREASEELSAEGADVLAVPTDVSQKADVDALADAGGRSPHSAGLPRSASSARAARCSSSTRRIRRREPR